MSAANRKNQRPRCHQRMPQDIRSSHLSSALSRTFPRAPSWAVPPRRSSQSTRRTPRVPDTTSSNVPSGAWGAVLGWAAWPCQPGQGTKRGPQRASPESIAGEARAGQESRAGKDFYGFFSQLFSEAGSSRANQPSLSRCSLWGGPHGTIGAWFQPIS